MLSQRSHQRLSKLTDPEPPFTRSQLFTVIALVMLGLGLFGLVLQAGMQEKLAAQQCAGFSDLAERASCSQGLRSEAPPRPAKGALVPETGAADIHR